MSFHLPWPSSRTARAAFRLVALSFVMALVGMSVVSAATISGVQNISNDGSDTGSLTPKVAQDPSGNIHVIWDSNEGSRVVRYAKGTYNSANGTYSFGASQQIASVGGFGFATPAIAVAPNGTVMALWSDGTLRFKTWNSADAGPSGNAVGLGAGIQASVYPDSNSNFHIAWNGDFKLQYCQWDGAGCATRTTFDDTTNAGNRPDIAVDSNNNVHIVWDTGQIVRYRTRAAGAGGFSGIQDIGGGNFAQIAADGKGNVHIVRSQDFNIVYCRKTISTACGSAHTLDAAQDLQPSIGVTRSGKAVVAFRDTSNTIWYDALEGPNGDTWQTTRAVSGVSGLTVDVSARAYTSRLSLVWSGDFEIRHVVVTPQPACEVPGTSTSVEGAAVSAAANNRVFLPLVLKQQICS
jgi:hypothetical protein